MSRRWTWAVAVFMSTGWLVLAGYFGQLIAPYVLHGETVRATVVDAPETVCRRSSTRSHEYPCWRPVVSYDYRGQHYTEYLATAVDRAERDAMLGTRIHVVVAPDRPDQPVTRIGRFSVPVFVAFAALVPVFLVRQAARTRDPE